MKTVQTAPTRRLLAGALALSVLLTSSTGAFARGVAAIGNLGIGLEDLLDPGIDVLPPAGANLPASLVPGVEFGAVLPGDLPNVPGAPATVQALTPVISSNGQLVTPLGGVASDGFVNGQPAQPGVLTPQGQSVLDPLISLRQVPIPPVRGLEQFVTNRGAAILLGKALFWDTQVGSDGQACASCHFHAGADNRMKNQLNPGLRSVPSDTGFNKTATGGGGPNYTLTPADFPFHRLADPLDRNSAVLFDSNDVVSSQGTFDGTFTGELKDSKHTLQEVCTTRPPDSFNVGGILTRKVEPRNTPSVINAVFNTRNFWDGRANNLFNGVSPFGNRDPDARVLQRNADGSTSWVRIALPNASLASQAVGPALSNFEMSCSAKAFPALGHKMLPLRPLATQRVARDDSVLGPFLHPTGLGLTTTYAALIKAAFDPKWWSASAPVGGYTQMENNFSLFWGVAIMLYESTLISDQAPIDKFVGSPGVPANPAALSAQQLRGLGLFRGKALCVSCHKGAEFTSAALPQPDANENPVEHMFTNDGQLTIYDNGFYNIGARPATDDLGVGAQDPWGNSLSYSREYLDQLRGKSIADPLAVDPCQFAVLVDAMACWSAPAPSLARVSVDGAFKTPSLRNVALTQPYFHNGGRFTLEQVVQFYNRGGDVRGLDGSNTSGFTDALAAPNGGATNVHPNIHPLGLSAAEQQDLVAFLRGALTDPRVACERAPFDHPAIRLFNGHLGDALRVVDANHDGKADDAFIGLPAVGASGLAAPNCLKNDDGSAPAL